MDKINGKDPAFDELVTIARAKIIAGGAANAAKEAADAAKEAADATKEPVVSFDPNARAALLHHYAGIVLAATVCDAPLTDAVFFERNVQIALGQIKALEKHYSDEYKVLSRG